MADEIDPVTGLPKTPVATPTPGPTAAPVTPASAAWLGTQPQVDDSMANAVTKLTSQDSALNQMARTEGLKMANSRGLLNSSMAVGSAQDAVLKNVLPIAGQDAQTAAAKNAAAKGFEYGMTAQTQGQGFQAGESAAERAFQAAEAAAGRGFQTSERLGTQAFQSGENIAARGWQTGENIAQRGFLGTQAQLDRDLQATLQANQITEAQRAQLAQISSTEGIEAANRALQKTLSDNDIAFRMSEGKLTREAATAAQNADIAFKRSEGELDRSLQQQIAKWNLSATQQQGAASMLTTSEAQYQYQYGTIMSNTALNAKERTDQLTAAKNLRDTGINLVEQMYTVDLHW